ncbi:MAG: YbjN domain-containing protein [Proteobacteria bacterium]|nr:YbjN domain-containing protein [Pseudomonadota bacterium]
MPKLSPLRKVVEGYLDEMDLTYEGGGPYLFRVGRSAVVISLFTHGDDTFCRFAAILLEDVDPTLEMLQRLLRLNTEVLFGSFLLFEEDTLAFSATLLGNHLDLDEFAKTLRYVAHVADRYADELRRLASGVSPLPPLH